MRVVVASHQQLCLCHVDDLFVRLTCVVGEATPCGDDVCYLILMFEHNNMNGWTYIWLCVKGL